MPGAFDRADALRRLADTHFDVLVVGGGITGVGCALDAASRGLRTALVERDDFASGTSSKSSKLVHGGLRYLQQGEVRLVYEALAERQRLLRNAPHLVRILPVPHPDLHRQGRRDPLEDLPGPRLGACGCTTSPAAPASASSTSGSRRRRRSRTCRRCPPTASPPRTSTTTPQTDDARLTLTIARTAALDHGAVVANHARVESGCQGRATAGSWRRAARRPTAATIDGHRRRRRQRDRRVGRRGRARSTKAAHPRLDPARPRASTSRCRGTRSATTSPRSSRCRRTGARSSSSRGATSPTSARPTPTTTARSTTRSARRTTSSTCSTRSTPS